MDKEGQRAQIVKGKGSGKGRGRDGEREGERQEGGKRIGVRPKTMGYWCTCRHAICTDTLGSI